MPRPLNADPLPRAALVRHESSEYGTFGNIYFKDRTWSTLEPPWKDNARTVSCIPSGTYLCKTVKSSKFGKSYEVLSVPSRSHILFHAGNWAGDESKKNKSNSNGCILLGKYQGFIGGQMGIASSRKSVSEFWDYMFERQIYLNIINLFV